MDFSPLNSDQDPPQRQRSPSNLKNIRVMPFADMANFGRGIAIVIDLGDGSYKYAKFSIPCSTTGIVSSLRQLADEIEREYQ